MLPIFAYQTTTVTGEPPTFVEWLSDYWWVILVAICILGAITLWIYSHCTRLHKIILYIGSKATTVYVQHGNTFSAPIPEGEGTFKGWFRDSACMIPFNSSDKIVSDFTLYSKFE